MDKRKKLKRQVSTDGGQTWQDMIPYEYIAGELIERDSPDCNNIEWRTVSGYICEENTTEMTQWVADTGYVCVGYDKYNKEKEQVSYNSGISWADTGNTKAGSTLIEANSTDCGYTPSIKATLTYQNGDTYDIPENGDSKLTTNEVRRDISDTSDAHYYTKITGVVVHDTVNALVGSFEQCTNLASITLPSTALEIYGNTFIYCESLESITLGNNITLHDGGANTFSHCNSLTNITIPSSIKKLPYGFLSLCENLKTVTIEATDFEKFYDDVFFNCTSLESITLKATIPPAFGYQMLYNVPANVKIYVPCASLNAYKTASRWSTYADRIQCEHDYSAEYFTTEALEGGTIRGYYGGNLSYSKNNGAWTTYTEGTDISVATGDTIRWKGTVQRGNSDERPFTSTGDYKVYGNIMSLHSGDDFVGVTVIPSYTTFAYMFYNQTTLKDASNLILPATNISAAPYFYYGMFKGCTSLTTTPALPATTLSDSCYGVMFSDCTSLTTAPELPATKLAGDCYFNMFSDCTSLTTAPALPATTLAQDCYQQMFMRCTSLTSAPSVLPSTTLAKGCYQSMFMNCTSLTTAPVLPATTLVAQCYEQMFLGCGRLSGVTCLARYLSASDYTKFWLRYVSSTGTFTKASGVTWPSGYDGIPTGWTIVDAT